MSASLTGVVAFFSGSLPLVSAARQLRGHGDRMHLELDGGAPRGRYAKTILVGNMGTLQKMDYTIMGNSVNLAARLEGVNKQYGTWILMSESTYDAGGSAFLTRKLDRVRVVGINLRDVGPVRVLPDDERQSWLLRLARTTGGWAELGRWG